jgi:hypothetical protein
MPVSSTGCRRCCAYGSPEQQRAAAEYLAAAEQERDSLRQVVEQQAAVAAEYDSARRELWQQARKAEQERDAAMEENDAVHGWLGQWQEFALASMKKMGQVDDMTLPDDTSTRVAVLGFLDELLSLRSAVGPVVFVGPPRNKPLSEIRASDIPRGLDVDDLAITETEKEGRPPAAPPRKGES